MYIKPNTTAEVVCPYKGNQSSHITWIKSNTIIVVGDTVDDGKGKFMISSSHGDGRSILQIVNFSARDEDMYRCFGTHSGQIVEGYFNIHMCGK